MSVSNSVFDDDSSVASNSTTPGNSYDCNGSGRVRSRTIPIPLAIMASFGGSCSSDVDIAFSYDCTCIFSPTGSNVTAIDSKIEQAMDLVKTHLCFAVREEIEVLRESIQRLQWENQFLRERVSPDVLAQLNAASSAAGFASDALMGAPTNTSNQPPPPTPVPLSQPLSVTVAQAPTGATAPPALQQQQSTSVPAQQTSNTTTVNSLQQQHDRQ